MNFQEKVQSMTAKEIIMAMVESLQNPLIKVDMGSFGYSKVVEKKFLFIPYKKKVCFGCAATNTICKISGKTFDSNSIREIEKRAEFQDTDPEFLKHFEIAIDYLRSSRILDYNAFASAKGFAQIEKTVSLPPLYSDYTQEQLDKYIELANSQPE